MPGNCDRKHRIILRSPFMPEHLAMLFITPVACCGQLSPCGLVPSPICRHGILRRDLCRRGMRWRLCAPSECDPTGCDARPHMVPHFLQRTLARARQGQFRVATVLKSKKTACSIASALYIDSIYTDFQQGLEQCVGEWLCYGMPCVPQSTVRAVMRHMRTLPSHVEVPCQHRYAASAQTGDQQPASGLPTAALRLPSAGDAQDSHDQSTANMDEIDCEPHVCQYMHTSLHSADSKPCASVAGLGLHGHAQRLHTQPTQQQQQVQLVPDQSVMMLAQQPTKRQRIDMGNFDSDSQTGALPRRPGKRPHLVQPAFWQTEA